MKFCFILNFTLIYIFNKSITLYSQRKKVTQYKYNILNINKMSYLFTFKETKEPCTKKQNETQEPLPNIKRKKKHKKIMKK
jgi:hypothetical protein